MNKALRNAIILGILLVSISFAYYFIYFLPSKENVKKEARIYCNQWAIDERRIHGWLNDYEGFFKMCLREQGVSN